MAACWSAAGISRPAARRMGTPRAGKTGHIDDHRLWRGVSRPKSGPCGAMRALLGIVVVLVSVPSGAAPPIAVLFAERDPNALLACEGGATFVKVERDGAITVDE